MTCKPCPKKDNETPEEYAARLLKNTRERAAYWKNRDVSQKYKRSQQDKIVRSPDEKDEVNRCRALNGLLAIVTKKRTCLRCGKEFNSNDAGNRRCTQCKNYVKRNPDTRLNYSNPTDAVG